MELKDEYETDDMPEPFVTSADLTGAEFIHLNDEEVLALFKYLKKIGAGEIYTQVDATEGGKYVRLRPTAGHVLYSRGLHFVNRTGVYAFVFNLDRQKKCPGDCNCRDCDR